MTALVVFATLLVAWAIVESIATAPDRPARGTLALATGGLLCACHGVAIADHIGGAAASLATSAIGGVAFALGVALRCWAIASLGALFATTLEPERVVITGPYRWLRHPSDVGLIVAALGGAALLGSWRAALLAVALVPLAIVRDRREDARLAELKARL